MDAKGCLVLIGLAALCWMIIVVLILLVREVL